MQSRLGDFTPKTSDLHPSQKIKISEKFGKKKPLTRQTELTSWLIHQGTYTQFIWFSVKPGGQGAITLGQE